MADNTEIREQEHSESAAADSARWDLGSHLRLWPIAVVTLAIDLGTKHWAFSHLDTSPPPGGWVVIPHVMSLRRSLNTGALFGLGKGLTPVFIAASLVALLFVLFLFIHSTRDRRSLHVALGLVLAGALGNLYDRLVFGFVRDMIQITGGVTVAGRTIDWPYIFNIADVYLTVGVVVVAITLLFGGRSEDKARKPSGGC